MLLAASAAAVRPGPAEAQSAPPPVVGCLYAGSLAANGGLFDAFRKALAGAGYVEGRTIVFEPRWADGDFSKLPAFAEELVRAKVAVIAAGGPPAIRAAKAATQTIPIVFTSGEDPVAAGFVASLARPGGNLTGVSFLGAELAAKRLDLARELAPKAELFAVLVNRTGEGALQAKATQDIALKLGKQLLVLEADTAAETDAAFASAAQRKAGAILVACSPTAYLQYDHVNRLAAKFRLPVIHFDPRFPRAGGLMSYGASIVGAYAQVGGYVARILKGAKPADLPVEQPVRFELVINLKSAKALGLTIPPLVLAQADEVIE